MSAPPPPAVPARPAGRTSLAGPVVLTAAGVLLLLGAVLAGAASAGSLVGAVRSDVLASDGGPGAAVLGWAHAPGSTTLDLEAGERYAVHLVVPRSAVPADEHPSLDEDVVLQAPSGAVVEADGSPGVTMRSGVGDRVAGTVGAFTAPETGAYTMTVPSAGVGDAWAAVSPDRPFGPFFGAIGGTIAGAFAAIGLVLLGVGAVVGGALWWVLRVRARRVPAAPAV